MCAGTGTGTKGPRLGVAGSEWEEVWKGVISRLRRYVWEGRGEAVLVAEGTGVAEFCGWLSDSTKGASRFENQVRHIRHSFLLWGARLAVQTAAGAATAAAAAAAAATLPAQSLGDT